MAVESLELIPALTPEGEGDAVLPVRWCVPKETQEAIKAAKAFNAHVLLIASYASGGEQRWLVPVEREMAYVQFRRPGIVTLWGAIVWTKSTLRHWLHKELMTREGSGYTTPVLYRSSESVKITEPNREHYWWSENLRDGYKRFGSISMWGEPTNMKVVVPERFFAKPNKALHWFANLPFSAYGRPVDQCAFRKRLIFTSILTAMVLAGIVGMGIGIAHLIPGLGKWFREHWGEIIASLAFVVGIMALAFVVGFITRRNVAQRVGNRLTRGLVDRIKAWLDARRERRHAEWLEILEEIACTGDAKQARLDALAPKRRTVELRFRALKAKVCRPYSQ